MPQPVQQLHGGGMVGGMGGMYGGMGGMYGGMGAAASVCMADAAYAYAFDVSAEL